MIKIQADYSFRKRQALCQTNELNPDTHQVFLSTIIQYRIFGCKQQWTDFITDQNQIIPTPLYNGNPKRCKSSLYPGCLRFITLVSSVSHSNAIRPCFLDFQTVMKCFTSHLMSSWRYSLTGNLNNCF